MTGATAMTTSEEVEILDYQPAFIDKLIPMWRESFEEGVGIVDWHPIEEQRQFFLTEVVPDNEVRVALLASEIVGFVAATRPVGGPAVRAARLPARRTGNEAARLGQGAIKRPIVALHLALNERAVRVYERRGFKAVERGFEETWQLADVRYEWQAPPPDRR